MQSLKEYWIPCSIHQKPPAAVFSSECMVLFDYLQNEQKWTIVNKSSVVSPELITPDIIEQKTPDNLNPTVPAFLSVVPTRTMQSGGVIVNLRDVDWSCRMVSPDKIIRATREQITKRLKKQIEDARKKSQSQPKPSFHSRENTNPPNFIIDLYLGLIRIL